MTAAAPLAPVLPNQDASAWLNSALDGSSTLDDLDTRCAAIIGHLDGAQADNSAQVEAQIDEIARSVPRLTFDLQLMREHALLLRFTLDNLRKQTEPKIQPSSSSSTAQPASASIVHTHPDTAAVMDELAELSLVKSRMEAALAVLREAESWSTLDGEVSSLIADKSFDKAAARLAEAARSMVVFQNTSEYESRRALMVSLQNSLEASLSNSLVKAIADRDVKACRSYFHLFGMIQREGEFRNYYYGSRRAPLVSDWSQAHQQAPAAFVQYLPTFFRNLLNMLTEELAYLPAIFPDPQDSLAALLQSTIDALVPSFHQRLNEAAETLQQPLPDLIAAYHHTEEFGLAVQRLMSDMAPPSLLTPGAEATSPTTSTTLAPPSSASHSPSVARDRRLSKRYSVSSRRLTGGRSPSLSSSYFGASVSSPGLPSSSSSSSLLPEPWEIALFEPFLDLQVDYSTLEQRQLDATIPQDVWADARALSDRIHSQFTECEAALGRCISFTHGYGVSAWASLTDAFLSRFIHIQTRQIDSGAAGSRQAHMDLEGLDYTDEDWGAFQNGAKLLGVCRLLESRLHKFEAKSRSRLAAVARDVKGLDENAQYLIPGTTRGALTLLRQSTLMSTDLNDLLAQVGGDLSSQRHLFSHIAASLRDLTTSSQMLLHDTILRPLVAILSGYAQLPDWSSASKKAPSVAALDINIPTFSLSPTDTIARLGEGLFNLPRLFEIYADDDALAYSLKTLPNLDSAMLEHLEAPEAEPQSAPVVVAPAHPRAHNSHGDAHTGAAAHAHSSYIAAHTPPPAPTSDGTYTLSAEEVVAAWLASLTNTILSHLTANILPSIQQLSPHGAQQLASDLSHMSNVAKTFDVENEHLERWREAAEMSDAEGRRVIKESDDADAVLSRMARMRGWA